MIMLRDYETISVTCGPDKEMIFVDGMPMPFVQEFKIAVVDGKVKITAETRLREGGDICDIEFVKRPQPQGRFAFAGKDETEMNRRELGDAVIHLARQLKHVQEQTMSIVMGPEVKLNDKT